MTNTRELMTVSSEEEAALRKMLVSGASSEAPPPLPLQGKSAIASTTKQSGDEVEWVIAAGNAAKAARRGGLRTAILSSGEEHDTVAAPSHVSNGDGGDDDVAGYNEKKNESTTPNTCSGDDDDVDDDDDEDYNSHNSDEEDGAYKTSSSATLSQSVHIVQQEDQERNALVASIRLFLVQTWNWLHYLFVTILFLNLFYADRGDSPHLRADTKQSSSSVVVGAENDDDDSEQSAEGGSGSEKINIASGSNNNSLLENSQEEIETMSPNTCSIQEKAQEAIMAGEKGDESVEGAVPQEKLQHPEITIIVSDSEDVQECDEEGEEVVEIGVMGRRDSVDSYSSSEGSGNMGDTEEGGKSEENNNVILSAEESNNLLTQKIISQVEAMFSDEHLAKDGFLLKHVRRRSDGFVSLKLVAGLRKVKQISRDFPVVLNALRDSTKLEINPEGSKVRRMEPLTSVLKSVPIKAKEKTSNKDKENGSSNDENQQPNNASIQQKNNRFGPNEIGKGNNSNNQNGSRRNSSQPINTNNGSSQSRRNSNQNQRKSSNTSTASSNNSRHNSFSKPCPAHPADLLRNVYTTVAYSSSGEDSQSPKEGRRRGGSLPIAALQRASGAYLSPNSSPPNGSAAFMGPNGVRPKSNSYCEGASPTTMSPWLQRRKASASSRLSSGELIFSGVVRQPRGPDGTKGFPNGYRAMILEERLEQQSNSAVSA